MHPAMVEKSVAALLALVCLVMLVRLVLPERLRWRVDAMAQSVWLAVRAQAVGLWHWRSSRKAAARLAEEAIRRARNGVEREGNVYRPRSFQEPRGPDEPRKPH